MTEAKPAWGIIRYAAGSGLGPEDDCAAFDGWYAHRQDAIEVYQAWCQEHPRWNVMLVSSTNADMRFSQFPWERTPHDWPDGLTMCPLKQSKDPNWLKFVADFEKIPGKSS